MPSTSYTDEIASTICERIADGASLRTICRTEGMPSRGVVSRWIDKHAAFAGSMANARVLQADALADSMADIEDGVLAGDIEPNAARVALGSLQWRAARLAPKRWGDRVETVHSGEVKVERITRTIIDPKATP